MRIIAFPPVGYVASRWEEAGRVQSGRGFFDGQRIASAFGPVRISASFRVSALAKNRSGAGYMEMLKRQMRHGVDLVRVKSPPVNWFLDHLGNDDLRVSEIDWTTTLYGSEIDWTYTGPLAWFNDLSKQGTTGTDGKGFDTITVTGLPPNRLVCRPADVVRSYDDSIQSIGVARALTEARTDASGEVTIRLDGPLPSGIISIGDFEERVFAVNGEFPSTDQTVSGNWFYPINLIEVLPAEYAGATEVDPWT